MINYSGAKKTAGSAEQCREQPAVSAERRADHHHHTGDQPVLTLHNQRD